ncbi:DUF2726 domain-containing protein [Catenovulum adriaticum]|uniref:DUF2726 domain-containing protein n=1 Tax=Catenovulum adriaticum TaxID=2984846 RepID=A0ABY7ASK2_9ALTE|nr:DUF2726 domain-containing protein [Catenovulum sp. TS8]WAJ72300.1 DUF2726 domain-containing protein [Catenovulum sp. TS8]
MELVIIIMMLVLVVVATVAIRLTQTGTPFPYQKKPALFTEAERAFMLKLEQAVGDQFRVVNRVRLSDMLIVTQGMDKRAEQAAKLKASAKTLDFVLLNRHTLEPVAAIDLVNTESKVGYKAKADWFVRGALETVGVAHVRIKVRAGYKSSEIRACLAGKMGASQLSPLNVHKAASRGPTRPIKPLRDINVTQGGRSQAAVA